MSGRQPPLLTLVAAVARNRVIGRGNRLPWHLPADLRRFRELTTGHAVIMGRKTWESLPEKSRPLPGRQNIVVTRNPDYAAPGAEVVPSLGAAMATARGAEAFVIGGAEIYGAAMRLAGRLRLTEIQADYAGDTWFPAFSAEEWREMEREPGRTDDLDYAFVRYDRIAAA